MVRPSAPDPSRPRKAADYCALLLDVRLGEGCGKPVLDALERVERLSANQRHMLGECWPSGAYFPVWR